MIFSQDACCFNPLERSNKLQMISFVIDTALVIGGVKEWLVKTQEQALCVLTSDAVLPENMAAVRKAIDHYTTNNGTMWMQQTCKDSDLALNFTKFVDGVKNTLNSQLDSAYTQAVYRLNGARRALEASRHLLLGLARHQIISSPTTGPQLF